MDDYPAEGAINKRYKLLRPTLDERLRRLWAAAEALAMGRGGVAAVSRATGFSQSTIRAGIKQLVGQSHAELKATGRARKPGAGRKSTVANGSGIERDLERLMESRELNDSGPLVWTCKSLRGMEEELCAAGHTVSYRTVGNLLHRLGYSFGRSGDYKKCTLADRREGFRGLDRRAASFLGEGEPVLSATFKNASQALPMVIPILLTWWQKSGSRLYPRARRLLLATESSAMASDWTAPLRALATEARLEEVAVAHFPPGTWRWQRSTRQAICGCSFLEGAKEVAKISALLELVLPGAEPVGSSYP